MTNNQCHKTVDEQAVKNLDFLNAGRLLFAHGIQALLLRDDYAFIQEIPEIDILIRGKFLENASDILVKDGWRILDSGLFHPNKRSFLKYVNANFLKIDLHLQPIDKWVIYDDAESYFVDAKPVDSAFYLPSDEVWLRHVICHIVLGKNEIAKKYKHRIPAVIKKLAITKEYAVNYKKNIPAASWNLFMWAAINWQKIEIDPELLFSKKSSLTRDLVWKRLNFIRFLKYHFIWQIGPALGWRRGFFVAVLGPDGAGKTTFLAHLEKKFQSLQITNRTKYMGPWEKPFLKTSKILSRFGASPIEEYIDFAINTKSKSKIFKAKAKRAFYYLNLPFEIWARYFFLILPHLLLRRVVLSDRYAHDLLIGHRNQPISSYTRFREFIVRTAPRPDFILLLTNDAETIWRRKKEYPLNVIEGALSRYQVVADKFQITKIKTDVPTEILVELFIATHWEKMIDLRRDTIRISLPFFRRNG